MNIRQTAARALLVAASSLVVALPAAAVDVPVTNPSFETLPPGGLNNSCGGACAYSVGSIPGWSSSGFAGQSNLGGFAGNPPASDGSVFAYIEGTGAIWQDVALATAGTLYTLNVDVLHRTDVPMLGAVLLQLNGTTVATAPIVDAGAGTWNLHTASWIAGAGDAGKTLTIRLTSTGSQGDFDNVRMTSAVPEPSSYAMALAGLAVLGAIARRRRGR